MDSPSEEELTRLLAESGIGDRATLTELLPHVYDELRRVARRYMRRENAGHTLQTTALVHEAYIRLAEQRKVQWENRAHFLAIAAKLMRRILIDHARGRHQAKRGGGARKLSLDQCPGLGVELQEDLVALNDALAALESVDARKCRVVELRYFAGLDVDETAEVLKISRSTVMRDWELAKAWLYREIQKAER